MGLPWKMFPMECRGFETALLKIDGVVAFGMNKKLKTIVAGVSR